MEKPTRFKIASIGIASVMLIGTFGILIGPFTINASAAPDTHTWDGGGGDVFAGTHLNWISDIAPEAGDSVVFDAGALPCTWNLSIALATFTITTGYTGTITQGCSFSVTSYAQGAGSSFTANPSYTLIDSGSFINGGTISNAALKLTMTGDGSTLSPGWPRLKRLTISANIASTSVLTSSIVIETGKTLTLSATMDVYLNSGESYTNNGTINNPSNVVQIHLYNGDQTINFGALNVAAVRLMTEGGATASRTVTLGAPCVINGGLIVQSDDATKACTLDTSVSNHSLSAAYVTIATGGIINGRASTITCSGNWDSANGTFIEGTSRLIMTGDHKYLKLDNTEHLNNLTINGPEMRLTAISGMNFATPSWAEIFGPANFSGPTNTMVRVPNGDYLAFDREAEWHVHSGDYGVMALYRSTDEGGIWVRETTLVNVTNRDVRNYASGTSPTGRTFIFYNILDVDNMTWQNVYTYKYSDDNGTTWSTQMTITLPAMGDFVPTNSGQVYGQIQWINDGGIGIASFCGNGTHSQGRFIRSFDNGVTWDHNKIWEPSLAPDCLTETSSLYLGNDELVVLARTDNVDGSRMFTSIDNGLTWSDRGKGINNGVQPSSMNMVTDNLGRAWVLAMFADQNVYYSIAYAGDLIETGLLAWPDATTVIAQDGMYPTVIWNETGDKGMLMVNDQVNVASSHLRFINITLSIIAATSQTIVGNLTVDYGSEFTFQTPPYVVSFEVLNQVVNSGVITQNQMALNISGDSLTPLTGYGTFDGDIYLNGSIASHYEIQTGLPMGTLHTDRNTTINLDASRSLRMIPSAPTFVSISMTSFTSWTIEASSPIASLTFVLAGLIDGGRYQVYVDGDLILDRRAEQGQISFIYSGPWSEHQFEVVGGLYSKTIINLGAVLGLMMALGIIVSILVPVAGVAREKRKFKADDFIQMVIYIVVSLSMLGVVYAVLP